MLLLEMWYSSEQNKDWMFMELILVGEIENEEI